MRRGLIIVGVLGAVAAAFFLVVASQADPDEPADQLNLSAAREMASSGTYAVTYDIDRSYGERNETARETVVRMGGDRYRGESTDSTGYMIIVIEREGARFQCESGDEIAPQCYRTDLRESLPELNLELPFPLERTPSIDDVDRDRREVQTVRREIAGEPVTCFLEASPELRSEWCYSADGILLYDRSEFDLAGQTLSMVREAVFVDRSPDAIDLDPPYPLVEPPTIPEVIPGPVFSESP